MRSVLSEALPDAANPLVAGLIATLDQRLRVAGQAGDPEIVRLYHQSKALGPVATALVLRHAPHVPSTLVAEFLVDGLGAGGREEREVFQRQLAALVGNPVLDAAQIARLITHWELTPKRLTKDWIEMDRSRDAGTRRTLWEALVRQNRLDPTHPLMVAMFETLATVPRADEDDDRTGGEGLFHVALGWPAHTADTLTDLVTRNPGLTARSRAWPSIVGHPQASPATLGQALKTAGSNFEAASLRTKVLEAFTAGGHAARWAPGMTETVLGAFSSTHSRLTLLTLLLELTPPASWPPSAWCSTCLADLLLERQGSWIIQWALNLPPAVLAHLGPKGWGPSLADPTLPREMRVGIIRVLGSEAFQPGKATGASLAPAATPRSSSRAKGRGR